jgi:hypothetical protein
MTRLWRSLRSTPGLHRRGCHDPRGTSDPTARDRSFRPRNRAIDWLAIERDYRAGLMSLRALGQKTRLFALDDRQLRQPTRLGEKATPVELRLGAASTVAITFQPRETIRQPLGLQAPADRPHYERWECDARADQRIICHWRVCTLGRLSVDRVNHWTERSGCARRHSAHRQEWLVKHTVIALFDSERAAQDASKAVKARGFGESAVHVSSGSRAGDSEVIAPAVTIESGPLTGLLHRLSSLFGVEEPHLAHYEEAVRRGGHVVHVDADDEAQAATARDALLANGAVNIEDRVEEWRSAGWRSPTAKGQAAAA